MNTIDPTKTTHEWPALNCLAACVPWLDDSGRAMLLVSALVGQTRWEIEQELDKQHWLDMAHPLSSHARIGSRCLLRRMRNEAP